MVWIWTGSRGVSPDALLERVALSVALAWPTPLVVPGLNLVHEDRIVISHPWGTGTTARGTFALEVTGADATEISFALHNVLREVDSKRTIPWSAISVAGSTDVKAGRVASFTTWSPTVSINRWTRSSSCRRRVWR